MDEKRRVLPRAGKACLVAVGLSIMGADGARGDVPIGDVEAAPGALAHTLDTIPRVLAEGEPLPCKARRLPIRRYQGTHIPYRRPIWIHEAFRPVLVRFEALARQVAVTHYGRAPAHLIHLGGYNCRTMRLYPHWVSEHALGNALDLVGFDFRRASQDTPLPPGLAPRFRRGFRVRIERHWNAEDPAGRVHAAFLRDLTDRVVRDADLFHVILGPGWPGHQNHLHFDQAPYRVVEGL